MCILPRFLILVQSVSLAVLVNEKCLVYAENFALEGDSTHEVEPSERIVNGREAKIEDHPYMAAVISDRSFCGGSIISKNEILTAAHCVYKKPVKSFVVRVGSAELKQGECFAVKKIAIHAKYNPKTIDYDIAILKLAKNLKFGSRVKAIKLAKKRSRDGAKANVTGWGYTSMNSTKLSDKLRVVTVPMVNQKTCKSWYKDSITSRMVCAGYPNGGKDACLGDSGGPLVDISNGQEVGVVSWGIKCAAPKHPTVYASVPDLIKRSDIYEGFVIRED